MGAHKAAAQRGLRNGEARMVTGMAVTLDAGVLVMLLLSAAGLGVVSVRAAGWTRRSKAEADERNRSDADLADMLRSRAFNRELEEAAERDRAQRANRRALDHPQTDALLRAQIDHMRELEQIWGPNARQSALEQVAAIMRRSVRQNDAASGRAGDLVDEIKGDGFTILVRGAQPPQASAVARRLRRELAHSQIEGLAQNIRLSASFGIASRQMGEGFAAWRARAEDALRKATEQGEATIVEADLAEDRALLPAPSPKASPKAA